jgi:hypothetical protein
VSCSNHFRLQNCCDESTVIKKYVNYYVISVRIENMDSLLNIKINKTYLYRVHFFPPVSVAVSPKMLKQKGCCAYISIYLYLVS